MPKGNTTPSEPTDEAPVPTEETSAPAPAEEAPVVIEETSTGMESGIPNVAADPSADTDPEHEPEAPAANGTNADGTPKISAYKKRLLDKGLDAVPVEGPQELVDMCRAAAGKAGDISLAAWIRQALAQQVNSLDLTHKVIEVDPRTGEKEEREEPWKFDVARLEATAARATSTRGLTEEQKKAKASEKKMEEKEEREYVKNLLAAHRAKLKGGDPEAKALEDAAKAKAAAAAQATPAS